MKLPTVNAPQKLGFASLFFFVSVCLYLLIDLIPHENEYVALIKHIFLFLSAMTGAHLLEKAFLWREITEWNKSSLKDVLVSANSLYESADKCGIEKIYVGRKDAVDDIIKAVENAKERVWMAGIAFSENLKLNNILDRISWKIESNDNFSFLILLTDVFKSPAVFRSFIEGKDSDLKTMIEFDGEKYKDRDHPYFFQKIYTDFYNSYNTLYTSTEKIKDSVKFHAHNPNCWLIIADKIAYFQPYTFGSIDKISTKEMSIGPLMPVFKIVSTKNMSTFNIVEDHFRKLWKTSTSDFFNMKSKVHNRQRIVRSLFKKRRYWLKHVYGSLTNHVPNDKYSIKDRRKYMRGVCDGNAMLKITFRDSSVKGEIDAKIVNISKTGICVDIQLSNQPDVSDQIVIDKSIQDNDHLITKEVNIDDLLRDKGKCYFKIVDYKNDGTNKYRVRLSIDKCDLENQN